MKSRSQLGQQGHCIQAVVEVREWSCVGDLAEFVAPGQLKLLIPCNFSQSNLMCLGMWLQSALRNTSSSMVTLIPPFLFSRVKNKEERNPAFVGRMLCLCHFPQGTTPTLSSQRLGVGSLSTNICPDIRIAGSCKDCWDICPLVWVSPSVLG